MVDMGCLNRLPEWPFLNRKTLGYWQSTCEKEAVKVAQKSSEGEIKRCIRQACLGLLGR
jgi:hypothetical protein